MQYTIYTIYAGVCINVRVASRIYCGEREMQMKADKRRDIFVYESQTRVSVCILNARPLHERASRCNAAFAILHNSLYPRAHYFPHLITRPPGTYNTRARILRTYIRYTGRTTVVIWRGVYTADATESLCGARS